MPYWGSWKANKKDNKKRDWNPTSGGCWEEACLLKIYLFLHLVSKLVLYMRPRVTVMFSLNGSQEIHAELLRRKYKFPLLTGGLWYWRANYATLATCSEGLPFPPPPRTKHLFSWHPWDFWFPNFRVGKAEYSPCSRPKNQFLDFEVHRKLAQHVQWNNSISVVGFLMMQQESCLEDMPQYGRFLKWGILKFWGGYKNKLIRIHFWGSIAFPNCETFSICIFWCYIVITMMTTS